MLIKDRSHFIREDDENASVYAHTCSFVSIIMPLSVPVSEDSVQLGIRA